MISGWGVFSQGWDKGVGGWVVLVFSLCVCVVVSATVFVSGFLGWDLFFF